MGIMGRLSGATDDGLVYHAMNRGNNGADVFADDGDHAAFLESLRVAKDRYPFALFGYCLVSNHFHLLLEPGLGQSICRRSLWPTPGDTTSGTVARGMCGRVGSGA